MLLLSTGRFLRLKWMFSASLAEERSVSCNKQFRVRRGGGLGDGARYRVRVKRGIVVQGLGRPLGS